MTRHSAGLAAAVLLLTPSLALAHPGHGVADGFLHPFTGIDHLFALLALGVYAAGLRNGKAVTLVVMFLGAFVLAFSTARTGIVFPAQEPMLAASLLGLGALILLGSRLPYNAALGISAVFAAYHGAAHGVDLGATSFAAALPGFLLACLLITGSSYALGRMIAMRSASGALRYERAAGMVSILTGLLLLTSA